MAGVSAGTLKTRAALSAASDGSMGAEAGKTTDKTCRAPLALTDSLDRWQVQCWIHFRSPARGCSERLEQVLAWMVKLIFKSVLSCKDGWLHSAV